MAIRRPPTTFSDSITGADLASDIAISTTGNIATTGSGTLTVAGNTTLSGTNNLGSNPTITLGGNATFPTGHVVKTYHAVFKGEQTFSKGSGNSVTNVVDTDYILVGTGASGTSGSPLSITCDTPVSSSSKYLITASITANNINAEFVAIKLFYNNSGVSSDTSLPDTNTTTQSLQTSTHFGASHNSVGGSDYSTKQLGGSYLWSPSSSLSQTIMVKVTTYSTNVMRINRPQNDTNFSYNMKSISTLVVQEIA